MDTDAVVDSSVWAAVWLREPGCEDWAAALAGLQRVRSAPFFRFEVANALWKRRQRLPAATRASLTERLFALPVDESFEADDGRITLDLACEAGLTFYDMAFVQLARRHRVSLWTLDKRQAAAAAALGVRCATDPSVQANP